MINSDVQSNAQAWELEVVCKNSEYLNAVIKAILKYGMINFEVRVEDYSAYQDNKFDGRYTVLMWCSWFDNLYRLSKDLSKIETRFEK